MYLYRLLSSLSWLPPALAVETRRATTAIYRGKDLVTPAVEDNIPYVTYEFEHFDLIFLSKCCLLAWEDSLNNWWCLGTANPTYIEPRMRIECFKTNRWPWLRPCMTRLWSDREPKSRRSQLIMVSRCCSSRLPKAQIVLEPEVWSISYLIKSPQGGQLRKPKSLAVWALSPRWLVAI